MSDTWTLDGFAIPWLLEKQSVSPPEGSVRLAESPDVDGARSIREPRYGPRLIELAYRVEDADHDSFRVAAADLGQRLRDARRRAVHGDPQDLVWAPERAVTAGDITWEVIVAEAVNLEADGPTWYLADPLVPITLRFLCQPYWRKTTRVAIATMTDDLPVLQLEVPDVVGDADAEAVMRVEDAVTTPGQPRRFVRWGMENYHYDPLNPTTKLITAGDFDLTNMSGAISTRAGAYDDLTPLSPEVVTATVYEEPTALYGTGAQTHAGRHRVLTRVFADDDEAAGVVFVRLTYRLGDGSYRSLPWKPVHTAAEWAEIDLGVINVPAGDGWDGRVEAYHAHTADVTLDGNTISIFPAERHGVVRAPGQFKPLTLDARDDLTGASVALHGSAADVGGNWSSTGDLPDFSREAGGAQRTTTSDGDERFAVVGSSLTNMRTRVLASSAAGEGAQALALARFVDSSNYLAGGVWFFDGVSGNVAFVVAVVSGVSAVLGVDPLSLLPDTEYDLQLDALDGGQFRLIVAAGDATVATVTGQGDDLATGGTLASGQGGALDRQKGPTGDTRTYSGFSAQVLGPPKYAIPAEGELQVKHDAAVTVDGANEGKPPMNRGARMYLPPGTSNLVVAARRTDNVVERDDGLTDNTTLTVDVVERGLILP